MWVGAGLSLLWEDTADAAQWKTWLKMTCSKRAGRLNNQDEIKGERGAKLGGGPGFPGGGGGGLVVSVAVAVGTVQNVRLIAGQGEAAVAWVGIYRDPAEYPGPDPVEEAEHHP